MNAELVSDTMLFADAVQRYPRAGGVADVVMEVVAGRPSGHGTLFDAECEPTVFRFLQQRNEVSLEIVQVLVHAVLLVAADKAADGFRSEESCGIEDTQHEVHLLLTNIGIVV